jgi:hypothetical protein
MNMSINPKDGSHIEFYTKEQVMECAQDLVRRYMRNPDSLRGIKFPFGLSIQDKRLMSYEFEVSYYGKFVGTVDVHRFGITYSK